MLANVNRVTISSCFCAESWQLASWVIIIFGIVHWPVEISTAAENRAISSSVSCSEHKLLAKSNTALTKSSQPWRETERRGQRRADKKREIFITRIPVMYALMSKNTSQGGLHFPLFLSICLIYTKKKCIGSNVLPRALNICMPPYFPSKSTVLLRGLNALHIRTKTTSKQPGRTMETDCDDFDPPWATLSDL